MTKSEVSGDAERAILQPLDDARVSRFHWKTILIAGMGFFTDAYDLFVIGVLVAMFVFYQPFGIPGTLVSLPFFGTLAPITGLGLLGASAIFGAALGPFVFGRLGDLLGRKTIYGLEMLILVVGALLSALAWSLASLILFRFFVGIGIGGDYPMSSTIMSEYSNVKSRGRLVGTVFAMQGFGLLAGVALAIGLLAAFPASLAIIWRVLLGAGAVPAALVYYWRRRLPETPRYSLHVQGKAKETAQLVGRVTGVSVSSQASAAPVRVHQGSYADFLLRYWPLVLGTALSWFLFDMSFYGTSIYTPTLLSSLSLSYSPGLTAVQHLMVAEEYSALIAIAFTIPGYWIAVALIDRVGRRTLQTVGFGVMALVFAVLGFNPGLIGLAAPFVVLYGLTFLFGNLGPNTTTFVVPTEVFPTQYRATGQGFAAGCGKIGAAISTLFFGALLTLWHPGGMMLFLALLATLGLGVTLALIPETKQRSLEELTEGAPAPEKMGSTAPQFAH
jgi:PHS family inorganic phosphate transporter-like MFS transporter